MENRNDYDLLTEWFLLDKNIVPPIYRLQSIRSKLPYYADDSEPEKKKEVSVGEEENVSELTQCTISLDFIISSSDQRLYLNFIIFSQ